MCFVTNGYSNGSSRPHHPPPQKTSFPGDCGKVSEVKWVIHKSLTTVGTYMPCEITRRYLLPCRGDIPAVTLAEAGTWFSDPGGMLGWVGLGGWLEMVCPTQWSPIQALTGHNIRQPRWCDTDVTSDVNRDTKPSPHGVPSNTWFPESPKSHPN